MIRPIDETTSLSLPAPACESPQMIKQDQYRSSLVATTGKNSSSLTTKLLLFIFFPLIWVYNWIDSKITPSTEELEMFEKVLEGVFQGSATFVYDRKLGEEHIKTAIHACEELYYRLTNKLLPNIEGIFCLRVNLLKIQIRACALIGDEKKVNQCRELLNSIGAEVSADVELQTSYLLVASRPKFRFFIWLENKRIQIFFKLLSFFVRK